MTKEFLEKLIENQNLSIDESKILMLNIMNGEVSDINLSAILSALKTKGETSQEIAGFVLAMREKSIKIKCDDENIIDVCGTGGDNSGSFNISTAVAFAAAGTGIKIAKHGNRSISSKCGSADVLKQLGVNINLSVEKSEEALNKIGIAFLFAPVYHPAMKHASNVRIELGIKTVFNMLGPLTNPAGTKKQLIGTFSINAAEKMAEAVNYLDMERVCFVCAENKFDEISLSGNTNLFEYNYGKDISLKNISNSDFGFTSFNEEEIKGGSPDENAAIIRSVFENKEKDSAYQIIAANTAMALYAGKYSDDLNICLQAAEESILSGKALDRLNSLIEFSNK